MLGYMTDPSAPFGLARKGLPDPSPASDECVVAVRAFGVNRGELSLLTRRPDGWTPGQDVSGVVALAAANGRGPSVGTRVVGIADGGGWSEHVAVPVERVAAIPEAVSFADASALPVAGLTALRALRSGGPLVGRRVLVTGATGGVGHFAVQLARVAGATVGALVTSDERVAAARAIGADEVFVGAIDDESTFDLVLDGVSGDTLVEALHHVATGGTVTTYGMASGEPSPLSFTDFPRTSHAVLRGFFVYETDVSTFGDDLGFLARLVGDGQLTVESSERRDWEELPDALAALRERRVVGKVTLTIG